MGTSLLLLLLLGRVTQWPHSTGTAEHSSPGSDNRVLLPVGSSEEVVAGGAVVLARVQRSHGAGAGGGREHDFTGGGHYHRNAGQVTEKGEGAGPEREARGYTGGRKTGEEEGAGREGGATAERSTRETRGRTGGGRGGSTGRARTEATRGRRSTSEGCGEVHRHETRRRAQAQQHSDLLKRTIAHAHLSTEAKRAGNGGGTERGDGGTAGGEGLGKEVVLAPPNGGRRPRSPVYVEEGRAERGRPVRGGGKGRKQREVVERNKGVGERRGGEGRNGEEEEKISYKRNKIMEI